MTSPSVSSSVPPSRSARFAQSLGYFTAFIALGLFSASLGPTLQGLAGQTGSRLNGISFLFSARAFGYLLGSLVSGRLYDRVPGHRVMAGVLVMMAAGLILVPLVPLLPVLAGLMLLLGMAEGSVDVGGNTLIVWRYGARVGPYMNALHFCFGVGAFLAPIIIAQAILLGGGMRWGYWALALLMLPPLFWLLRTPSPRPLVSQAERADGRARPYLVFLIAAFLFLYVAGEASYGGWVYSYAMALGIGGAATAAYLTSAFWGAVTIGRLLSIPIAVRFRPATILLWGLLGTLLGLALVVLGRAEQVALWAGTFVVGFSMAPIFPTTISFASTRMNATGRVTGWFLVGASLGGMTWPWLIGQLFESVGPQVVMWLIGLAVVLSIGVYGLLMLDARRDS
jgi:MFS transporter, FHS family, Na+ dependent glucose transporter 1